MQGVLNATDNRGADLVIESTGKMSAISDGISMARPGATILLLGITTATEGALPFYQLYFKELSTTQPQLIFGGKVCGKAETDGDQ